MEGLSYVKKKQNTQDAHEAIRPSYIDKTPESIKKYLTAEYPNSSLIYILS